MLRHASSRRQMPAFDGMRGDPRWRTLLRRHHRFMSRASDMVSIPTSASASANVRE